MSKLLLLSNSTMPGTSFFSWPRPYVKEFLGKELKEVVFIPFAAVSLSYDAYFATVSQAFDAMGYGVRSVHTVSDKKGLIKTARAIVVGGGNTFALLSKMYEHDLLSGVKARVATGAPYIGWSAGANLACPTLKTTNDMPVVMPSSFDALNVIPFQINPHYHELRFETLGGETRKERIVEFLLLNPGKKVIGLPEGMLIVRDGKLLKIRGEGTAKLFGSGKSISDLREGADISFLL
ncbi:MAG: dipeptidase PepE [Cyclobacteriaceae bacterium]